MRKLSLPILSLLSLSITTQAQENISCNKSHFQLNVREATAGKVAISSMNKYDVHFYKLDLNIERNTIFLSGNATIAAKVIDGPISTFLFELHQNFAIDSILINGFSRPFTRSGSVITVSLASALNNNASIEAIIYYFGTAPSGASAAIGNGFSTGTSGAWGNQATWSLSEPYAAYEWFPVKQDLYDKADSSEFWITTDSTNKAGSNGILLGVTNMPNGKKRWEWKSRYPIVYYLISVSVAKYVDYTIYAKPAGYQDSIKIVNYIYDNPATLPNFLTEINKTVNMMNVFSAKYGLYPFHLEKYGHCMAPFSGGMEHQTMTTQGFFNTTLTAHELGHQWFGDYVTCASWKDIWINEGFATYSEYVYLEAAQPADRVNWLNSKHNNVISVSNGSVYVDDTASVPRIFSSRLSYNKGAFLLHMLRFEINNDSLFFAGLRNYAQQYSFGVATGLQFKASMETTTGMNFSDFFDQWYFGQGYPTFSVQWNHNAGLDLYLQVNENVSASGITPLFKTSIEFRLTRSSATDTVIRVYQNAATKNYTFPAIQGLITAVATDPNQWILNGTGSVVKNTNLVFGIDEEFSIKEEEITIYPNPVKDEVTIRSTFETADIEVVGSDGRILKTLRIAKGENKIETSSLAKGLYYVRSRNLVMSRPFVKE